LYSGSKQNLAWDFVGEGEDRVKVRFNFAYSDKFFENAHIVGSKMTVYSDSVGHDIDMVAFTDLEKVNTEDRIAEVRAKNIGTIAAKE